MPPALRGSCGHICVQTVIAWLGLQPNPVIAMRTEVMTQPFLPLGKGDAPFCDAPGHTIEYLDWFLPSR